MRKMCMVYVIFVVLFCAVHVDFAVAATNTSGVKRSLLQNVIVEVAIVGHKAVFFHQ